MNDDLNYTPGQVRAMLALLKTIELLYENDLVIRIESLMHENEKKKNNSSSPFHLLRETRTAVPGSCLVVMTRVLILLNFLHHLENIKNDRASNHT